MRSILIDAEPLIALFDKSDQYHSKAIVFMKAYRGQLFTTWPVVTEVCYMLNFSTKAQLSFLEWIERGGLRIVDMNVVQLPRLISLTRKYNDVPMDLADASLIVASELFGIREVASIDSDFYIYRDLRNQYLVNVFN